MKTNILTNDKLTKMATALRIICAEGISKAGSGHPGMPLGMADVVSTLYGNFLEYNPKDPTWLNRDRVIFSAGHGSMLLYSTLHMAGYEEFTLDTLENFRQLQSVTAGHPEIDQKAGVECTTGPLGHGLAMAIGMAIASKKSAKMFGEELFNHKIYVIAGDGCLMEGISYEAIALAGNLKLDNLVIIWDDNNITIDGKVDITSSEDQKMRFEANGFTYLRADGHNFDSINRALNTAKTATTPVIIAAKTTIGKGAGAKENSSSVHGSPLSQAEIDTMKLALGVNNEPFAVSAEVYGYWEEARQRAQAKYLLWQEKFNKSGNNSFMKDFFAKSNKQSSADGAAKPGLLSKKTQEALLSLAQEVTANKPSIATRNASKNVLSLLSENVNNLVGGSADLAASVMSKPANAVALKASDFEGNYINFGIREHAMGAIVNGMAAYGGFVPYGGTFLIFSDFLRPAIRLAALQKLQSIFIFSHDSIGVGEDGPTHQPVEQLLSLNIIPNLEVLRPCDTVETIEAWEIALSNLDKPTCLILSRQNLPTLRQSESFELAEGAKGEKVNLTSKGAYLIGVNGIEALQNSETLATTVDVNLIASGSEVSLAMEVSEELFKQGVTSKVISQPSYKRFISSDPSYVEDLLGQANVTAIIEAAIIGDYSKLKNGNSFMKFGVDGFGFSGKANEVYAKFGLTKQNITTKVLEAVKLAS